MQAARAAAAQEAVLARAAEVEALLAAAFQDDSFPPDLEFGCFSAVVGPPGSDFEGEALLRMDTGISTAISRGEVLANL